MDNNKQADGHALVADPLPQGPMNEAALQVRPPQRADDRPARAVPGDMPLSLVWAELRGRKDHAPKVEPLGAPGGPVVAEGAAQQHTAHPASDQGGVPAKDSRLKRPLRRSGGPRTEEGRRASSRNSLKHGAYATRLPEELADQGHCLTERDAHSRLGASGELERGLASAAGVAVWLQQRLNDYTIESLRLAERRGPAPGELWHIALGLGFPLGPVHRRPLMRELSEGAPNELLLLRHVRRLLDKGCELAGGANGCPSASHHDLLAARVLPRARDAMTVSFVQQNNEPLLRELDEVMEDAAGCRNFLGRWLNELGDGSGLRHYWLYRNRDRISHKLEQHRLKRCIDVITDPRVMRARSHLNRSVRENVQSIDLVRGPGADVRGSFPPAANSGRGRH
jgi:hypothetical protein